MHEKRVDINRSPQVAKAHLGVVGAPDKTTDRKTILDLANRVVQCHIASIAEAYANDVLSQKANRFPRFSAAKSVCWRIYVDPAAKLLHACMPVEASQQLVRWRGRDDDLSSLENSDQLLV